MCPGRTCVVAMWQVHDEVVGISHLGRSVHVLVGGILAAILDVLPHRTSKQQTLLAHHRDLKTNRMTRISQWPMNCHRMVYNEGSSGMNSVKKSKQALYSCDQCVIMAWNKKTLSTKFCIPLYVFHLIPIFWAQLPHILKYSWQINTFLHSTK